MVNLTTADADSAGAQLILHAIRQRWPFIKHLFADGACGLVPAAIGNAVFDATGVRLRRVPFTPERVKAMIAKA
jgi:hypothetical protein